MRRKKYLTQREKNIDFVLGFVGFPLLNLAIYLATYFLGQLMAASVFTVGYEPGQMGETALQTIEAVVGILPWVINFGLLVFLAWWRLWIAIGALAAWVFLVGSCIMAGVCFFAGCLLLYGVAALSIGGRF